MNGKLYSRNRPFDDGLWKTVSNFYAKSPRSRRAEYGRSDGADAAGRKGWSEPGSTP